MSALAGDGLTIPLLLTLGAHPALATVIGVLPYAFSTAQLLVPWLLRRFDGNLRGVTIAILLVGETRGFILAGLTFLAWSGRLPHPIAIVAIGAVMTMAGAATTIGGANLLAWYGAILPDPERRFVAPRVMGVNLGPRGVPAPAGRDPRPAGPADARGPGLRDRVLDRRAGRRRRAARRRSAPASRSGPRRGAPAGSAGTSGTDCPGRAAPAGPAPAPAHTLDRFLRSITLAAFGAGFGPYLSIYAISVLGLPAAFAILLAALASGASLVSATIVGGLLGRGSSSRTLRLSFLMRGGSMILGLLTFPQNPLAWLVLCAVATIASAGAAAGTLSSNERLMRLAPGPDLIGAQGRFVAGTALGITAGQLLECRDPGDPAARLPGVCDPVRGIRADPVRDRRPSRRVGDLVGEHDDLPDRGSPRRRTCERRMTVTTGAVPGFLPSTAGFHFANRWPAGPALRFALRIPVRSPSGWSSPSATPPTACAAEWPSPRSIASSATNRPPADPVPPAPGTRCSAQIVRRQVDSLELGLAVVRFYRAGGERRGPGADRRSGTPGRRSGARSMPADQPRSG